MSMKSFAGNDTAELMTHTEDIHLGKLKLQADIDGRIFYSDEFVSGSANNKRSWRWTLLRSGDSLFNFCVESLSDRPVTLSSVEVYGGHFSTWVVLTEKKNIGQSRYQSGDFSVASSLPGFDEVFVGNHRCWFRMKLEWFEAKVVDTVPMSSDCVLESLYTKVMDCGDSTFELVTSDDKSFRVNVAIFDAKSPYFMRFFGTDGWKEQAEGRMMLPWTSAVAKQLIRYVYLNNVDGDFCELLPDILDAAQMWELVDMKPLIEAQMRERLQKAARDADTDTAAEHLKMAHLHNLASLVPICNGILADNYDQFYDSVICKQMINSSEFTHLIKAVFHHKRNTHD